MLSPQWTKKSGRLRSIVAYVRMPPCEVSMPQPWPAVSPDHTNEIERLLEGAVRKRPTVGSPISVGDDKSWQRSR
jgi:hypothetical protein